MPIILNRISYQDGEPSIPIIDTANGLSNSIPIFIGEPLANLGVWFDSRFCNCGTPLDSKESEETGEAELSTKTECRTCARRDFFNTCSIMGVIRPEGKPDSVDCVMCYKFLQECSSGYCVYVAILTDNPLETKVGTTKISRIETRLREAGYAAMSIVLPKGRSSISLPEADYIEKRILDGVYFNHNNRSARTAQFFHRNIGYVGGEETRKNTLRAFITMPTESLRKECELIAEKVIERSSMRSGYSGIQLFSLEIDKTLLNDNLYSSPSEIMALSDSQLSSVSRHTIKGRPYREIPNNNVTLAVKGPCALVKNLEDNVCYSIMLTRANYHGREVFDPAMILPGRENSTMSRWIGGA